RQEKHGPQVDIQRLDRFLVLLVARQENDEREQGQQRQRQQRPHTARRQPEGVAAWTSHIDRGRGHPGRDGRVDRFWLRGHVLRLLGTWRTRVDPADMVHVYGARPQNASVLLLTCGPAILR